MPDDPAQQATHHHGRDVDPRGDFDAERDRSQKAFDDKRDAQVLDHREDLFPLRRAEARFPGVGTTRACQFQQQLGDGELGVSVPETAQSRDQRNEKYLQQRPFLDHGDAPERACPDSRCFDEDRTRRSSEHAEEDEHKYLEEPPIRDIADLENDNLAGAVRVQEFQEQGCCL